MSQIGVGTTAWSQVGRIARELCVEVEMWLFGWFPGLEGLQTHHRALALQHLIKDQNILFVGHGTKPESMFNNSHQ